MKSAIIRFVTLATLSAVLFAPGLSAARAEGTIPSGGRPPIPSTIVLVTDTYTLYADGTVVYSNGTTVYPDGTTVYPDGTVVYPAA